jgi:hypothetical protein
MAPGGNRCLYFGYSNGNVRCVYETSPNVRTSLPVRLAGGQLLDVGDDANIAALDLTGDSRPELLIANSTGAAEAFTLSAADTLRSLGKIPAGGMPLAGAGGLFLAPTIGSPGELPGLVFSDGNGAIFRAGGILRGDINGDGTVDVLDLQQLGIHWGQRSADAAWLASANLQVDSAPSDPQIINVLDLQVLGMCWGMNK